MFPPGDSLQITNETNKFNVKFGKFNLVNKFNVVNK